MTKKIKTTAPVSSVGADGAQPQLKNHTEIIANETAQINLQAVQNQGCFMKVSISPFGNVFLSHSAYYVNLSFIIYLFF